jgi:hypothetical protein
VVENLSADIDAVAHRAQDVDDGAADGRFAAPGFAYQSERFAAVERERHAVNGTHFCAFAEQESAEHGKPDVQVLDFKNGSHLRE